MKSSFHTQKYCTQTFSCKWTTFTCCLRFETCNFIQILNYINVEIFFGIIYCQNKMFLTVENVKLHSSKLHLIFPLETSASCVQRWRFIFFLSCLLLQILQTIYWWQVWMWTFKHCSLVKYFLQPGSPQKASIVSSLTAIFKTNSYKS